jgi:D-amino-acid dehydrogenase
VKKQKICIVGSGLVGLFTAWQLQAEGHEVTVVERRHGPSLGTSYANGAQLSYSYVAPLAGPSALLKLPGWLLKRDGPLRFRPHMSIDLWRWCFAFASRCTSGHARQTTMDLLTLGFLSRHLLHAMMADGAPVQQLAYRQNGKLVVFRDAAALAGAEAEMQFQSTLGCKQRRVSPTQCVEIDPALADLAPRLVGGIYTPSEDVIDNYALALHLAKEITGRGGCVRYGETVQGFDISGDRLQSARTDHGEITADQFVVAGGLESREIFSKLGVRVPILGLRGYSITLDCSGGLAPDVSVTDSHHKIVFARIGERLRVAGMVDVGSEAADLPADRLKTLISQAMDTFPRAGNYDQASAWAGVRPATPSGRPIIDQICYRNLYANMGHGALGLTLAAGSAALLADRIAGRQSAIDPSPFTLAKA